MWFFRKIGWVLLAIVSACVADNSSNSWQGIYTYYESAGSTVGGSPIMMNIKLTIKKDTTNSDCIIEASGYQTDEKIYCTSSATNNVLTLFFKSFDNGTTKNKFDVEPYKIGEKLFTLERNLVSGKQERFIPNWVSYSPFGDGEVKPNEYFEKTGTK